MGRAILPAAGFQPAHYPEPGVVRVVSYYLHNEAFPIFLLTVYAKNQKANLTKAEQNDLKALVPFLIRNYRKGRQK